MNSRLSDPVALSFGLDTAPLLNVRSLWGQQVSATHIVCGQDQVGMSARVPREDAFHVSISLTNMPRHELWSNGKLFISGGWAENATRIVNLEGNFAANVFQPHEGIGFHIPRISLDRFTEEAGAGRVANLSSRSSIVDTTMAYLARSLLPAFAKPEEASILFVDHVMLAVCAHVAERYGGSVPHSAVLARGKLTPAQTARAKELLAGNLRGELHLADIAKECGISRQYFMKAFKKTLGCTPHQWLQQRRLELVKDLLTNTKMPVGEIARKTGFSDQAHLTRVFGTHMGLSPAAWRRLHSGLGNQPKW